jgi:hypothetical protein
MKFSVFALIGLAALSITNAKEIKQHYGVV